jgi:flagellar biogenesis protein FliO
MRNSPILFSTLLLATVPASLANAQFDAARREVSSARAQDQAISVSDGASGSIAETPRAEDGSSQRFDRVPFRRNDPAEVPREDEESPKLPQRKSQQQLGRPASSPANALFTVMGSLGVVLGLFLLVVWFTRRALPRAATTLPTEVVELLGRMPLSGRQNMHVIRFGPKLLLVSVTQGGAETLSEITDADEVERVAVLCKQNQPGSVSASFRNVLAQFAREPAPGGFLGLDANTGANAGDLAAAPTARRRRATEGADA